MSNSLPSSSLIKTGNNGENKDAHSELPVLPSNQTEPTMNHAWGPFYVQYAPFRAKISPVYAVGVPLIMKGRVFGLDTHQPLAFACIDIWQASPETKYDYYEVDPNVKFEYKNELNTHGRSSHFNYRARLISDEQGRYEYETVKPAAYFDPDDSTWRCPHIHYYVQASGYKPIVTQLYFKGEERNDTDRQIHENTTIELIPFECERVDGSKFTYFKGEFDIIMDAAQSEKKEDFRDSN